MEIGTQVVVIGGDWTGLTGIVVGTIVTTDGHDYVRIQFENAVFKVLASDVVAKD